MHEQVFYVDLTGYRRMTNALFYTQQIKRSNKPVACVVYAGKLLLSDSFTFELTFK